jgi:hypothetical protein
LAEFDGGRYGIETKWTELRIPSLSQSRRCIHRATAKKAQTQTGPVTELSFQCNCNFELSLSNQNWDQGGVCCTTLFSHPVATVQRIRTMETLLCYFNYSCKRWQFKLDFKKLVLILCFERKELMQLLISSFRNLWMVYRFAPRSRDRHPLAPSAEVRAVQCHPCLACR